MSDDAAIELTITNFAANQNASGIRNLFFGPAGDKFSILIEIDPTPAGAVDITVGNGPADTEFATAIPEILRGMADVIEEAAESPEFIEQFINIKGA